MQRLFMQNLLIQPQGSHQCPLKHWHVVSAKLVASPLSTMIKGAVAPAASNSFLS